MAVAKTVDRCPQQIPRSKPLTYSNLPYTANPKKQTLDL